MHFTEERFRSEVRSIVAEVVTEALASTKEGLEKPEATRYLTRKEAAQVLKVSLPTLTKLTKQGSVKGYRIGRHLRYKSTELDAALKEVTSLKYTRNR